MIQSLILAALVVGTWNGKWFPSGRAEHRAAPELESVTIAATAKMLRGGINRLDPMATNDLLLCLHEIRDLSVATSLVFQIGRDGLRVVSISAYRRRDRFDQQQDVIATTLPVLNTGWSAFRRCGIETPPRGYAFANLLFHSATTAVYSVHLKSNYGAKTEDDRARNRAKRSRAVNEILELEKLCLDRAVIVGGDFNADRWKAEFAEEPMFDAFSRAGFWSALALMPSNRRGTYRNSKYGDSAFDDLMIRLLGPVRKPTRVSSRGLSDHDAVFVLLEERHPLAISHPSEALRKEIK